MLNKIIKLIWWVMLFSMNTTLCISNIVSQRNVLLSALQGFVIGICIWCIELAVEDIIDENKKGKM